MSVSPGSFRLKPSLGHDAFVSKASGARLDSVSRHATKCRSFKASKYTGGIPEDRVIGLDRANSVYNGTITVYQLPSQPNPTKGPITDIDEDLLGGRVIIFGNPRDGLCAQSVYFEDKVITGACWDTFALLPSLVPEGRIAIYGFGGGTAARLISHYHPDQKLDGWELDGVVVEMARKWMGVEEMEREGTLKVYVGDCFSDDNAMPEGGYSGLAVDVYGGNDLLVELRKAKVWTAFKSRLKPGGRIIVNLQDYDDEVTKTLEEVFDGQVLYRYSGTNLMALTGPKPSESDWGRVPMGLTHETESWYTRDTIKSIKVDEDDNPFWKGPMVQKLLKNQQ